MERRAGIEAAPCQQACLRDVRGDDVRALDELPHSCGVVFGERRVHLSVVAHHRVDEQRVPRLSETAYELLNVLYLIDGSNISGVNAVEINVLTLELIAYRSQFIREVYAVKRRKSGVVRKERRRNSAALHPRRRQHRYRGGQRAAPNAGKILYRNNSFHSVQL